MYRKPLHLCPTKFCRNRRAPKKRECSKCAMRVWRAANPVKALLADIRHHAAENGVPYDLDLEWFTVFLRDNHYDRTVHHIDRIERWKGYTKGNLQVLLAAENIAKGNRERHVQKKISRRYAQCPF